MAWLRRSWRRRAVALLIAAGALLVTGAQDGPAQLLRAPSPPAAELDAGLEMTVAATAGRLTVQDKQRSSGDLLLQVSLDNKTGHIVSGLRVIAPIPRGAGVVTTPGPSQGDAKIGSEQVVWTIADLPVGNHAGPFSYRVRPPLGTSGATFFMHASFEPRVTWTTPSPGQAPPVAMSLGGLWGDEGLRRTLLPSGLTVFTRERPDSPTVALRVAVRAGSRDEDETTLGGSHWLEHAHFLGTVKRPTTSDVHNLIADLGGQSNASTGWEATDFWSLVPAEDFDVALDGLADQLVYSTFGKAAFDQERRVVAEELKQRLDSPSTRAFDEFIALVFRTSPLRRIPAGTIASVQSIPIQTILAYRASQYVTGNTAVAVIGNIHHDDVVAKVQRAFAEFPPGPRSVRPVVPEPPQTDPRRLEVGSGTASVEIRLGWPVPGRQSPEWPAMVILDDNLDGTDFRLREHIREREALASNVGSTFFWDFSDASTLMLSASCAPENVDAVIAAMLYEVERLRNGEIFATDVENSRRAIIGRQALRDELNQPQTARAIAEVAGTLQSPEELTARLSTVSATDVQRVAQRYLDPANYTLVLVRS